MRTTMQLEEAGGTSGPRVLLLPGLGARGTGFRGLAQALATVARPVMVDYPQGRLAACGAGRLARDVLEAAGPVDAVIASSFAGMIGGHLASMGAVSGLALLGSFTDPRQLGLRGRLIPLMGPIAELGRPGLVAASLAAFRRIPREQVPEIVPSTPAERRSVLHRAFAIPREAPPPPLHRASVSCICLHGDRDVLVPVSVLPRVARALPRDTPLHVLRGAGHVPYFTHVEQCFDLLAPWLKRLEQASPDREVA